MRSFLIPLSACFMLGACGSVVMSTTAVLGMSSPLEEDPAGYEIAVTIPEGVDVPRGGARLSVTNENTVHGIDEEQTYELQRRATEEGQTLFRINPADLNKLRARQARIAKWEMEDPDANSGSFSVWVEFCAIGDGPSEDDVFNVSIRTKADGRFMPLIRNAQVKDAIALLEENGG